MQSQNSICCGARSWALTIGWIQTIFSGISTVIYILVLIDGSFLHQPGQNYEPLLGSHEIRTSAFAEDKSNLDSNEPYAGFLVEMIVAITILFVSTVMGAVLITGVNGENPSKLKVWLIMEIVLTCIAFVGIQAMLIQSNANIEAVVIRVIAVVFNIFCLWVVNVHRQELLGLSGGEANLGFNYDKNQV